MKKKKKLSPDPEIKDTNNVENINYKPASKKATAIGEEEYEEDQDMKIRMKQQPKK